MAVPIKVSESAYRRIVSKKGELTMKTGRNISIIEAVDVIVGIGSASAAGRLGSAARARRR
jgi:hypothetical protein